MTFHDSQTNIPDPEVVPKAKRRKFSAEYKRRILEEANDCAEPGQIGALLRREGLYSSHLSTWRRRACPERSRRNVPGFAPLRSVRVTGRWGSAAAWHAGGRAMSRAARPTWPASPVGER